ncbi:MAG: type II 3-dehydroquinate dehydratase [Proteobacteria bacterium]|nr:type II 3-dehydroquinate dehydratase [Pseudomonadota bacterium]MBW3616216.1 type II 3-dehydroquinate dehydratase [Pseudomonadota bacterium]
MAAPIYVLNGPNLNLLGQREPEIYGRDTLGDLQRLCDEHAARIGASVVFRQTNHEGELIDWVQEAGRAAQALIINAAGYTHTSIALLDALRTLSIPVIEVHLSNPAAREPYRRRSYVAEAARGTVSGFGALSYTLALDAAVKLACT